MKGILYKHISPVHEDERRSLTEIFNGEFTAKQFKMLHVKKDALMGNHYHPYRQFFYFLKGDAEYSFVDIKTGEKCTINAKEGDFIIIDAFIAHKALQKSGNMMIEGNEQPYTSPDVDDLKFEIK